MKPVTVKDANIYAYPTEIAQTSEGSHAVVGDLNGDVMRMMYFLVREGVLDITAKQYEEMSAIYHQKPDEITREDIDRFIEILDAAKVNKPTPFLHFIGDDLADRGKYDFLTLLVYKKLGVEKIGFEVLHSNHGIQFLYQYSRGLDKQNTSFFSGSYKKFGMSMHNTQQLLKRGVITLDEISEIMEQHYLPKLKLLSAFTHAGEDILITHAPVVERSIERVAELLGIKYVGHPFADMVGMADKLNEVMQILCRTPIVEDNRKDLNRLAELLGVDRQTREQLSHNDLVSHVDGILGLYSSINSTSFMQGMDNYNEMENYLNERYGDLMRRYYPMHDSNAGKRTNLHGHASGQTYSGGLDEKWKYVNLDKGPAGYMVYTDNTTYKKVAPDSRGEVVCDVVEAGIVSVSTGVCASPRHFSVFAKMSEKALERTGSPIHGHDHFSNFI